MPIRDEALDRYDPCYYCGRDLGIERPVKRFDRDGFHLFHLECSLHWDSNPLEMA